MGAAIEVFEGALALQVPRRRFAPVKTNNDLLVVRSDVYSLNEDYTLTVAPGRHAPGLPLVSLDSAHYGLIRDFEERFRVIPSLLEAESFSVAGDILFDHPLKIVGKVSISVNQGDKGNLSKEISRLENTEVRV
jgi:UTP--glucose-1-phosphate uridylyltransferase